MEFRFYIRKIIKFVTINIKYYSTNSTKLDKKDYWKNIFKSIGTQQKNIMRYDKKIR